MPTAWNAPTTPREEATKLSNGRQILIGNTLPNHCVHETIQPFQRVTLYIAVVQAEAKLIDIPAKVLRASMVVDAIEPASQNGVEGAIVRRRRVPLELPSAALASASLAEPVKDEPRRLLSNPDLFRQLD